MWPLVEQLVGALERADGEGTRAAVRALRQHADQCDDTVSAAVERLLSEFAEELREVTV
jgi:hypothetical protein